MWFLHLQCGFSELSCLYISLGVVISQVLNFPSFNTKIVRVSTDSELDRFEDDGFLVADDNEDEEAAGESEDVTQKRKKRKR